MAEIAEKARVSRPAVSHVLSGGKTTVRVGEETRQRILKTARQHGYRRNEIARAIATGKSRAVGFVVGSLCTEYAARMLEGVVRVANRHGFFVKVLGVDAGADAIPRLCIELRLEAVIGIEMDVPGIERMLSELGRHRIPLLVLDRGFEHPKAMSVFSDDAQGMRLVVEHLVGLGHSRIAFVGGDPGAGGAIVRAAGFRAAMTAEGLSVAPDDLRCGYWDDAATESAVRALLGRPDRPTAVVCASDPMAMVAIRVAHQAGLRVPADVSLVGFADLAMARYASPPLTTVAQPFVEMGMAAMRRLHDTITGEGRRAADSGRRMLLPTQLVVRQSSGPVPSQKRAALAP